MEYTLRALRAKDLFLVTQIITKIGFKEFKEALKSDNVQKAITKAKGKYDDKAVKSIGAEVVYDVVAIVISNLDKVENELYKLIANVSSIDEKDVRELELADFTQIIVDMIKEPKNRDFIKVASKLIK